MKFKIWFLGLVALVVFVGAACNRQTSNTTPTGDNMQKEDSMQKADDMMQKDDSMMKNDDSMMKDEKMMNDSGDGMMTK